MRQQLWIPGKLPGMNELVAAAKGAGGRGAMYAKLKREWTNSIGLLAKAARLRPVQCARFEFVWRERDRRRDPDNIAAGGKKLVMDSLVTVGVLPNDGWGNVLGWTDTFEVSDHPGVLVTIDG